VKPAQRLICGGIFTPDPGIPPDHNGRRTCRCGLTGVAGDPHHTVPEPVDDARSRAAGESGDEG
jgi:hypothetical protein